jgi:TolB protein
MIGTPLAAPPAGLTGRIIMRSGQVIGDDHNQPIYVMRADASNTQLVSTGTERGHSPVFSPDGLSYAFVLYAPGTRELVLQTNNLQGTAPKAASARWGGAPILTQQDNPAWSPNGSWIAFTALGPSATSPDLYRTAMAGPEGNPDSLERLTDDGAIESWPSFSPDGEFIVYTASFSQSDQTTITELRIFNLANGSATGLTSNGNELVEAAPDWSPDGQTIVFQAQAADASHTDIYWMRADGSAPAEKLIDSPANDLQPRFSPDGRHIVFSSDRTGNWDVFIYDLASETTYQLTTDPRTDVANDWVS